MKLFIKKMYLNLSQKLTTRHKSLNGNRFYNSKKRVIKEMKQES